MTTYELQLHKTQTIQSLLINATESCVINNIAYSTDYDEGLPLNEVSYPLIIVAGKKMVALSRPIEARVLEFTGVGLEHIIGINANDSTLAPQLQDDIASLQSQIDNIVAGNMAHVHHQDVPSATWVINHSLGYNPNVTVVDSAGSVVHGNIVYINNSQIQLSFIGAFAGKAYLS